MGRFAGGDPFSAQMRRLAIFAEVEDEHWVAVEVLGGAVFVDDGLVYFYAELFEYSRGADDAHTPPTAVAADGEEVSVEGNGKFYADALMSFVIEQRHRRRLADLAKGLGVHGYLTPFVYADINPRPRLRRPSGPLFCDLPVI